MKKGIAALVVALLGAGCLVFTHLHKSAEISEVITDEAQWDLRDASPQAKVVIMEDGTVARYVSEDDEDYIAEIQDLFSVAKKEASVETWYASDGKGVVYLKEHGTCQAHSEPDSLSSAVTELHREEGYVPDTYHCLGYKDGWFTIEIAGRKAYIDGNLVCWDAVDSF